MADASAKGRAARWAIEQKAVYTLAARRFREPPRSNGSDARYEAVVAELRAVHGTDAVSEANRGWLTLLARSGGEVGVEQAESKSDPLGEPAAAVAVGRAKFGYSPPPLLPLPPSLPPPLQPSHAPHVLTTEQSVVQRELEEWNQARRPLASMVARCRPLPACTSA